MMTGSFEHGLCNGSRVAAHNTRPSRDLQQIVKKCPKFTSGKSPPAEILGTRSLASADRNSPGPLGSARAGFRRFRRRVRRGSLLRGGGEFQVCQPAANFGLQLARSAAFGHLIEHRSHLQFAPGRSALGLFEVLQSLAFGGRQLRRVQSPSFDDASRRRLGGGTRIGEGSSAKAVGGAAIRPSRPIEHLPIQRVEVVDRRVDRRTRSARLPPEAARARSEGRAVRSRTHARSAHAAQRDAASIGRRNRRADGMHGIRRELHGCRQLSRRRLNAKCKQARPKPNNSRVHDRRRIC